VTGNGAPRSWPAGGRNSRLSGERVGPAGIALLANNVDVLWVMHQVGHADSKMTLDVYAQLQQRVNATTANAFDRLVRQAQQQLGPEAPPAAEPDPSHHTAGQPVPGATL
jgi:hypothetical protein